MLSDYADTFCLEITVNMDLTADEDPGSSRNEFPNCFENRGHRFRSELVDLPGDISFVGQEN
ncbi:MAG: hypothetical protein BWY45_02108 [Euryarchaeota archaeon ADurb.Bin294]|jgi:hypothetical protein|nr:MAG: hypothetical protein BWY45_02108 [Euryarchaeota archaeon ADurb.Bin294]